MAFIICYSHGSPRIRLSVQALHQMTSSDNTATYLFQVTDTHLFADASHKLKGVNPETSLQEVIALIRNQAQNLHGVQILATGDLVHDSSKAGYARLHRHLSVLNLPIVYIPGNHDDPTVMADVLSYRRHIRFEMPGWQCLMLNSYLAGSDAGMLDAGELAFLDEALASHANLHTLICLHHSPVSIASTWMDAIGLNNAAQFLDVIALHPQIKIVLFGHIHQLFDQQINGVCYMASPSTCIQFKPGSITSTIDENQTPGYRWLKLYPDGCFETGVERVRQT